MSIDNPAFIYYATAAFKAIEIDREGKLSESIGLSEGPEVGVFTLSFAQRILRTAFYNTNWLVSLPGIDSVAQTPIIGRTAAGILDQKRQSRVHMQEALGLTEEPLEENRAELRALGMPRLPRTIELAVNDLTAKSSVEQSDGEIRVDIYPQFVRRWSGLWLPKIEAARIPESL